MADDEVVGDDVVVGEEGVELGEAEGGEDGHDVCVVAKVQVEGLVQGEGDGVVVQCGVNLGDGAGDEMVVEAGSAKRKRQC